MKPTLVSQAVGQHKYAVLTSNLKSSRVTNSLAHDCPQDTARVLNGKRSVVTTATILPPSVLLCCLITRPHTTPVHQPHVALLLQNCIHFKTPKRQVLHTLYQKPLL